VSAGTAGRRRRSSADPSTAASGSPSCATNSAFTASYTSSGSVVIDAPESMIARRSRGHGDPGGAHGDALQGEEVEGRVRRVRDERGGLDAAGVGVAVELGGCAAERDEAALGLEHGGEAVGEARDVELGREGPPAAPEPRNAGLVGTEHALVEVAAPERDAPPGVVVSEGEAVGGELADGERLVAVVVHVDAGAVPPAPPPARGERERAAPGRVAGERRVGGRRGGVQEREALVEAVAAGRALRPHQVAARVQRQRHGPRRRAHGQVHQVLVRRDPAAAAGAHPCADRVVRVDLRRRQQPPPPRPGAVRHAPHEVGTSEAAAGVGVREHRHHAGAGSGRGARGQRQDEQHEE
jgi:hypothetical protein